jgi:hypothetical protein
VLQLSPQIAAAKAVSHDLVPNEPQVMLALYIPLWLQLYVPLFKQRAKKLAVAKQLQGAISTKHE